MTNLKPVAPSDRPFSIPAWVVGRQAVTVNLEVVDQTRELSLDDRCSTTFAAPCLDGITHSPVTLTTLLLAESNCDADGVAAVSRARTDVEAALTNHNHATGAPKKTPHSE